MKIWIMVAIVGLLVVAGFAVVNAFSVDESRPAYTGSGYGSCGEASCDGGCTASNNCGNPTCGAVSGGSCGCRG